MKKIVKSTMIPRNSVVLNEFGEIDYFDTYSIQKNTSKSAEEIAKELLEMPAWVIGLMKLRNAIVKIFGLKTDKQNKGEEFFFTLIEKNDNEIVMGEIDKHLDFRLSIMKDKLENTISVTTVVHYNNRLGRFYFFVIKPFHQLIMKTLLKRYLKRKELGQ